MANGATAIDEVFMQRCIELAATAAGNVAPNPMVGAVLVFDGKIIGEGYHKQYGHAHAEVNCINSVTEADKHLITRSVLYVSLEPCAHFGKTPPCADLIIQHKIPKVVIGAGDPFKDVNGKGIEKLKSAGVEVVPDVLKDECIALNKRFFTFHQQQRPYIILKWAQTADGMMGSGTGERLFISNQYTNRLVHKWRSEEAAILVGTNTALQDDPSLNVRNWKGKDPVRLVIDMDLRLPSSLKIFDRKQRTIVFNSITHKEDEMLSFFQLTKERHIVPQVLKACYQRNIQSILVEGGAKLLQSFIDEQCWDETRVITNTALYTGKGLPAPLFNHAREVRKETILNDSIAYFAPDVNNP